MVQKTKIKLAIIEYLESFSTSKLQQVLGFVEKVSDQQARKERILSRAGSWKNIDATLFDQLTMSLPSRRYQDPDRGENVDC